MSESLEYFAQKEKETGEKMVVLRMENNICSTCGKEYESIGKQINGECPACIGKRWEADKIAVAATEALDAETTIKTTCVCGTEFDANVVQSMGRVIYKQKHCNACLDDYERRHSAETARENRERRVLAWTRTVPPQFIDTNTIRLITEAKMPSEVLKKIQEWSYGPRGIFLSGPTGRGKSRSMYLLLRRLYVEEGVDVHIISNPKWTDEITAAFGRSASEGYAMSLRAQTAQVLYWDEFSCKGTLSSRILKEMSAIC